MANSPLQLLNASLFEDLWHTLAVLSEHAICFKVKPDPYSAANDKHFAPWGPREGSPEAPRSLASRLAQPPPSPANA